MEPKAAAKGPGAGAEVSIFFIRRGIGGWEISANRSAAVALNLVLASSIHFKAYFRT